MHGGVGHRRHVLVLWEAFSPEMAQFIAPAEKPQWDTEILPTVWFPNIPPHRFATIGVVGLASRQRQAGESSLVASKRVGYRHER